MTTQPAQARLAPDTRPKEPVLVQDITGSYDDPASPVAGSPSKRYLATSIARILVSELSEQDAAAADESAESGKGGLLTYWFANGTADELGDLTPANFSQKWDELDWGGPTYIMPALQKMEASYHEEFDRLPESIRPILMAVINTDGALADLNAATRYLQAASGWLYCYVVVLGYGPEHDRALAAWQQIAASNPHVRVESVNASTDAHAIAQRILAMVQ